MAIKSGDSNREYYFNLGSDNSDDLANNRGQFIEFYHVPSDFFVKFKAFLLRFSDALEQQWNDEDGFGRMDPLSTYKKTGRRISLSIAVPAGDVREAVNNFESLSVLQKMQYGSYDTLEGGANSISTGPLMKIKFMNFIQNSQTTGGNAKTGGLLGKMSGLTFSPNIDAGFFDFVINGESSLIPKEFDVSFEFTVLHQHKLGWSDGGPRSTGFDRFPYGGGSVGGVKLSSVLVETSGPGLDFTNTGDENISIEDEEEFQSPTSDSRDARAQYEKILKELKNNL